MSEPWWPDNIADGVHSGDVCLKVGIYRDVAFLDLDTNLIQSKVFNVSGDADCHEGQIGLERGRFPFGTLDGGFDPISGYFERSHFTFGQNLDAAFFERPGKEVRYFVIFNWKNFGHHLHETNFGAKRVVEIGKLHTNSPSANNQKTLRKFLQDHRLGTTDHTLAIKRNSWQRLGASSSC